MNFADNWARFLLWLLFWLLEKLRVLGARSKSDWFWFVLQRHRWTSLTKYLNKWWTFPPEEACTTSRRSLDCFEYLIFGIIRDGSFSKKNDEVGLMSNKGFKLWEEEAVELADIRSKEGGKLLEGLNNSWLCSIETCLLWIKFG